MFERFSEDARQVIIRAQESARQLDHGYIGTEHLLLGLVADGRQLQARVLESRGVVHDSVHARVLELVGRGTHTATGQIPFTPRAKKTLELSLRAALSLGHDEIQPAHVLLGLLSESEGLGARILLVDFRVDGEELREQIVHELPGAGGHARPTAAPRPQTTDASGLVHPDAELAQLLAGAARRAIADGREEMTIADLQAVAAAMSESQPAGGADAAQARAAGGSETTGEHADAG